jgi:hypothetical protein
METYIASKPVNSVNYYDLQERDLKAVGFVHSFDLLSLVMDTNVDLGSEKVESETVLIEVN